MDTKTKPTNTVDYAIYVAIFIMIVAIIYTLFWKGIMSVDVVLSWYDKRTPMAYEVAWMFFGVSVALLIALLTQRNRYQNVFREMDAEMHGLRKDAKRYRTIQHDATIFAQNPGFQAQKRLVDIGTKEQA